MLNLKAVFQLVSIVIVIKMLAGCAAVETSVAKRNLDVQARTSASVFVDPVARDKRSIYVDIRSGVLEFDRAEFKRSLLGGFENHDNGYQLTDDPESAHYQMLVYVLNLEKTSPTAAERALSQGYSSDRGVGGTAGAIVGAAQGGTATSAVAGGILGSLVTTAANAFVQDVTYMLVADIKITEKTRPGVIVRKDTQISDKVSDSGTSTQRVSEATNRKEYKTRIVTTANKANLKLETAQALMFEKTAYAMRGFF